MSEFHLLKWGVLSKLFLLVSSVFYLVSCAPAHLDVATLYPMPGDTDRVNMPKECRKVYDKNKEFKVAVLEFSNNTGYGESINMGGSSVTQGSSVTSEYSASRGRRTWGGGYRSHGYNLSATEFASVTDSSAFIDKFAPELGGFAQGIVERALASYGSIKVLNRAHLDKIIKEQKFQMTIADQNHVVQFGKLAGAQYIVTGSIDSISTKYIEPVDTMDSTEYTYDRYGRPVRRESAISALFNIGASVYNIALTGWIVEASLTINFIDVSTGEILTSQNITEKERASQSRVFSGSDAVKAAQKILNKAVGKVGNKLTNIFEVKGYINELRGGKKVAKINLGRADGVHEGDVFDVYMTDVSEDVITGRRECSIIKTGAKISISNQLEEKSAWGSISGNSDQKYYIMLGSYVKRSSVAKQK